MLKGFAHETRLKTGKTILHATEYMDDGSPINLTVTINETQVSMVHPSCTAYDHTLSLLMMPVYAVLMSQRSPYEG